MKYFLLILTFLIFQFNIFSFDIKDYELFIKGKEAFEQQDFKTAENIFLSLLKKHPDSKLFKSTYANFYLGKAAYNNKNFDLAYQNLSKTNYFPAETNILKSKSLIYLNKKNEAFQELSKMYTSKYNFYSFSYEKEAFELLIEYDNKFNTILELRYNKNFKNSDKLTFEDLILNGDFFFSRGDYKTAIYLYKKAINIKKDDDIELKILNTMFFDKQYEELVNTGLKFLKTNSKKANVSYHIADGYRRQGNITKSIEYMLKADEPSLKNERNLTLGRLYYINGEYTKALTYLSDTNSTAAEEYIIKSYEKMGNSEEANNILLKTIAKNPYSEKAAEYRYILYKKENNENYLNWIIKYNFNSFYYDLASNIINKTKEFKEFEIEEKMKKYEDFFNKINYLAKLNDSEFMKIEFNYTDFPKEDSVFKAYLQTKIYETNQKYYDAVINSWRFNFSFTQHKNLAILLYPKYYNEYVEKYSKEFDVDKHFVFSIIKQESLFKEDTISKASAYGLMQIIIPTAKMFDKNITPEKLLNPEKNVEIGVRYLKYLLDKYNGNMKFAAAAYNAGPNNVDKWIKNNDLDIEKIPFSETKQYVKKVLSNYNKYNYFYNESKNENLASNF